VLLPVLVTSITGETDVSKGKTLIEAATSGRTNTPQEWMDYLARFHEQLPNANELFALLKTRSDDTSYTMIAQAVPQNARDVLDLACGDGNLIEELLQRLPVAKIYGIDISSAEIAIARQRYGHDARVDLRQGDALELPYDNRSFDCVAAHQFLNLLPDVDPYLVEIARVLRRSAPLVFVANRHWQNDRTSNWTQIGDAAFAAVRAIHPDVVWPRMGDLRMYSEEGIREVFTRSSAFDSGSLWIGSFTSRTFLTPDRVAAVYNRLYFYGLLPEKKQVLEAVASRAQELATRGDLVELALPFRLVSVRTK
jgi:ubiquinone/menaquinone biosynthesis C-methylase UbiE